MSPSKAAQEIPKIGDRISVFWPDDVEYYSGTVAGLSGLNVWVTYDDGDEEIINILNEVWKFQDDDSCNGSGGNSAKNNHDVQNIQGRLGSDGELTGESTATSFPGHDGHAISSEPNVARTSLANGVGDDVKLAAVSSANRVRPVVEVSIEGEAEAATSTEPRTAQTDQADAGIGEGEVLTEVSFAERNQSAEEGRINKQETKKTTVSKNLAGKKTTTSFQKAKSAGNKVRGNEKDRGAGKTKKMNLEASSYDNPTQKTTKRNSLAAALSNTRSIQKRHDKEFGGDDGSFEPSFINDNDPTEEDITENTKISQDLHSMDQEKSNGGAESCTIPRKNISEQSNKNLPMSYNLDGITSPSPTRYNMDGIASPDPMSYIFDGITSPNLLHQFQNESCQKIRRGSLSNSKNLAPINVQRKMPLDISLLVKEVDTGRFNSMQRFFGIPSDKCVHCKKKEGPLRHCSFCVNSAHLKCYSKYRDFLPLKEEDRFMCYICLRKVLHIVRRKRKRQHKRQDVPHTNSDPADREGSQASNKDGAKKRKVGKRKSLTNWRTVDPLMYRTSKNSKNDSHSKNVSHPKPDDNQGASKSSKKESSKRAGKRRVLSNSEKETALTDSVNDHQQSYHCRTGQGPGGLLCCADCASEYSSRVTDVARRAEGRSVETVAFNLKMLNDEMEDARMQLFQTIELHSSNNKRRKLT